MKWGGRPPQVDFIWIYLDFRVFTWIFCMFPFLLVWPSSRTFLQRHRSIPYLFSPCYLKYCFSIMTKEQTKSSSSTLAYGGGFPHLCCFLKGGCFYLWEIILSFRRRQWHPTPVLLPGKSHGEEPGRLRSMVSLSVGHTWATSLSLFTFMHWRRKWQPTPVFLPGESQGWQSLVDCRLWGRTELDTTDAT